jgi:hypothetical protein
VPPLLGAGAEGNTLNCFAGKLLQRNLVRALLIGNCHTAHEKENDDSIQLYHFIPVHFFPPGQLNFCIGRGAEAPRPD